MAGLSFAAIDVETANSARGSICAVGVTVVRDGRREATASWLCRPPAGLDFFNWHNIRVHGISAAMVADQPCFGERFPEVVATVGDLPLIAHNAGFDSGAIREACVRSGIQAPAWDFSCSLSLARRHLNLDSYRLPHVAAALGIDFTNHHDAAADAAAAADIVIALAERSGVDSLAALERLVVDRPLRTEPVRAASGIARAQPEVRERPRRSWFGHEELVIPTVTGTDPTHPLCGEIIVFTGDLTAMKRQEAWNAIAAHGATPARNVTRRTTGLVIGDGFQGTDPAAFTTSKARRVVELRARGQRIEVMDEAGFLACLGPIETTAQAHSL
ncbi:exonuclease domain-containing protein [Nocardia concava]|uniref:exonuclease domain-containing protein n=1 Tax=Nocardia concava TaxID=257281 RepID=UPI00031674FF|nr:exonuclease domain-containing protein [Nocardia concava]